MVFNIIIFSLINSVAFYMLSRAFSGYPVIFVIVGTLISYVYYLSTQNSVKSKYNQKLDHLERVSNALLDRDLSNHFLEGDISNNPEIADNKVSMILSSVSNNFSKSLENIKTHSQNLNYELNNYRNEINKNDSVDNSQLADHVSILKKSIDDSLHKSNDMKIVFEEASASAEEITACSGQIYTSIEALTSALEEVSAIVEETSSSIENITSSSQHLLASTEETSAAMIQLSSNAKQSVSNAQETASVAQQMKSAAQDGNHSVQETVQGITSLREIVVKAAYVIENLGKNTQKIGDIVSVIRDIADQTNLLALNAAIEAARAGEHGRGFAVVADEVRKLAERSSQATKEIGNLIKGIQEEALDAVEVVRGGASSAEEATKLAQQAGTKINQVLDGVEYTAQLVDKIANSSIDQSGVADIVAESTSQMNQQVMMVSQSIKEQSIGIKHIVDALSHITLMMDQIQKSVYGQSSSYTSVRQVIENLKDEVNTLSDLTSQELNYTDNIFEQLNNSGSSTNDHLVEKIESIISKNNEIINEINKYKVKSNDKDKNLVVA